MALPTLEDIAKTYKDIAKSTAPVRTGAMRDRIAVSYSRLDDLRYQLDLNGISYMLWWNTPPKVVKRVKLARRPEFNFVVKASQSKLLRDKIDEYTKAKIVATVADNMLFYLDKNGYGKVKQVFRKKS